MAQIRATRTKRTVLLAAAALSLTAGIALAGADFALSPQYAAAAIALLLIIRIRMRRLPIIVSIIILGFCGGWWRGQQFARYLEPYQTHAGQKVLITGVAKSDGVYDGAQISFDAGDINLIEPEQANLPGKIAVKGYGVPAIYSGDILQVEGKLYKTRGSRLASISYAEIAVTGSQASVVDDFRREFSAGMQNALPEPAASFGMGLLIGQRSTLPETSAAALAAAGLTHIIAVSGYNLTIIARGVKKFTGKRSKYQTLLFSLFVIGLFLLVTGFSASIVRAAIVSMLSIFAWYYGRDLRPVLIIAVSAAITAAWYPPFVWKDIGWYLSFLAFFGVLVLAPLLTARIYRGRKSPGFFGQVVIESLCAQMMTAPLIMFIFGRFSIIGLLANVLVVPLVPAAMLLSAVGGVAGILSPAVAGFFGWPAKILLTYMLDIASVFSRWRNAQADARLSASAMIIYYALILVICILIWLKVREYDKITPKELVTEV